MLWTFLTFILVALTKYLTSLRLRNLRDKIQKDQKDATDLKRMLTEASEKNELLRVESDRLMSKATALHTVINNIERALQRGGQAAANE